MKKVANNLRFFQVTRHALRVTIGVREEGSRVEGEEKTMKKIANNLRFFHVTRQALRVTKVRVLAEG